LRSPAWANYYGTLLRGVTEDPPPNTPNFQNLIQDFIARGTEVAGRKQVTLRPYWQWVVYTYGPPLLEALGTFRFLLTELVPLGLIFAQGAGEAEELTDDGTATEANIPF
jgi:hypothetical protein